MKQKMESAFVNMGILSYPSKVSLSATRRFSARFSIKEVYVGLEMRRFKRVIYKVTVKLFLSENKTESLQTVDISEGGICFIAKKALKTDARISIKLELDKDKEPVYADARVAWVKRIELLSGQLLDKYKIGVEFIDLKTKYRKLIAKVLKS